MDELDDDLTREQSLVGSVTKNTNNTKTKDSKDDTDLAGDLQQPPHAGQQPLGPLHAALLSLLLLGGRHLLTGWNKDS